MADPLAERLRAALALHQSGQVERAAGVYAEILRVAPRHAEALHLLGLARITLGDFEAGAALVRNAIKIKPKDGLFRANLGLAYLRAGRFREAVAPLQSALALDPRAPELHDNFAGALALSGDLVGAIQALRRATRRFPGNAHLHIRLAALLLQHRELPEARAAAERALALAPGNPDALVNLGLVDAHLRDYAPALARFEAALDAAPMHITAQNNFVYAAGILGDFARQERAAPLIERRIMSGAAEDTWTTLAEVAYICPYLDLSQAVYRRTLDMLAARFPAVQPLAPVTAPALTGGRPDRPLRVGYVSTGFGNHAIGHVTRTLFAAHDRARFRVFGYPILARGADEAGYFTTIRAGFDEWRDLTALDDAEAAAAIRADGIDILVDLNGFLEGRRPGIFAYRPAPIQVFWLAHAGGLGLPFIDYLIGDRIVVPPGEERLYRERLVRLPLTYHCADTLPIAEETPEAAAEGLGGAPFVFCAFNNPQKIDRRIFMAWMRILAAVPESRLWLSDPSGRPALQGNFRGIAEAAGIAGERIVFAGRIRSKSAHLARHRLAGLFLDTATVNAATTALDALWAGLPVLTLRGNRWASRMAQSMVAAIGLEDALLAPDLAAYERRAIQFAGDPEALAAVTARLAQNRATHPLFDIARFCRHLERAFEGMWRRFADGLPPAAFDLEAE
ncbi:MAG: tetratricopeptide repeat protein [Alphaproteobacteria bacterium]|nr:tetratricopeptide repeat protein [Alphaproteobacteria bacterium]